LYWWQFNANKLPPEIEIEPQPEKYIVQKNDSIWKIAKRRLPVGASDGEVMNYVIQISIDNGKDPALIDGILQSGKNDPDLIFPGEILNIYPYK
jgi:nucleoid-associated protein YgaU